MRDSEIAYKYLFLKEEKIEHIIVQWCQQWERKDTCNCSLRYIRNYSYARSFRFLPGFQEHVAGLEGYVLI